MLELMRLVLAKEAPAPTEAAAAATAVARAVAPQLPATTEAAEPVGDADLSTLAQDVGELVIEDDDEVANGTALPARAVGASSAISEESSA